MSIAISFNFDPAEHYRATRAVTRHTWLRWIPLVFGLFAVVVLLWTMWLVRASGRPVSQVLINTAPWLALLAAWMVAIPLLQRWSSSRLGRKDPSVQGLQERSIDAAGYHSRGNGVSLDVPWHILYRVRETAEFLLFFYNAQCAYYIPKRVLTADQLSEARRIIRDGVGADKTDLSTAG